MRLALGLFLSTVLAGCAAAPGEIARKPLGPCDERRFVREEAPPAASQRVSIVLLAVEEWVRFGRQTVVFRAGEPPRVTRAGTAEDGRIAGFLPDPDAPRRVAAYWRSIGWPGRDGTDGVAWSAAFVSWVFLNAGVPTDRFCPDQTHAVYLERLAERAHMPDAALVPRGLDYAPRVGDLVCAERQNSRLSFDNLNRGPGHCDIVVEVQPRRLFAIGGNVSDSVSRSEFPLDGRGRLVPVPGRPFFGAVENRLP